MICDKLLALVVQSAEKHLLQRQQVKHLQAIYILQNGRKWVKRAPPNPPCSNPKFNVTFWFNLLIDRICGRYKHKRYIVNTTVA
jgi:hypothetical protein